MKFRIIGQNSNANTDYRKRKKPPMPPQEKSIPDNDLCMQKGKSYRQALKAHKSYHYKGKPYGIEHPHV